MLKVGRIVLVLWQLVAGSSVSVLNITLSANDNDDYFPVPLHFWKNTGFCPPAPTNSSPVLDAFFNGVAVHRTMDMLAAWPAVGDRTTVRVHWLLNLIDVRYYPFITVYHSR